MSCIEINVNDNDKIVEIWLTTAENGGAEHKKILAEMCEKYKPERYKFAVYKSGSGGLFEQTTALLLHNR